MWKFNFVCLNFVILSICAANLELMAQQENEKKTIRRVKRPEFATDNSNEIYFDDVYKDALVGERPEIVVKTDNVASDPKQNSGLAGFKWSEHISRDALEDEVKRQHRILQTKITTPSGFNSKFGEVRQSFEMLAVLFAVIHEYDEDVRWKKFAATGQSLFSDAAVKARTPSKSAFQLSKLRKEDLSELIRGGAIELEPNLPAKIVWPEVIGRRTAMIQLETALREEMKPAVSNAGEFKSRKDHLLLQANLIAALAQVLVKEGMDEADDDGYRALSIAMGEAAELLKDAVKEDQFEAATKAWNQIEQSCDACHSEWRG